jgi:predicted ATPase/DNA-binding SARP family transcriptional activator
MPRVEVRVLGGFEVTVDGGAIPRDAWRRRHAATLVKLLALAPGHRLHRELVIDALWPEVAVEDAAPRLHKAAHYARSAMGSPSAVVAADESFALCPDGEVVVDALVFEAHAERARRGEAGAAEAAVERYRGDLLPDDPFEEWAVEPRQRLRLRHLELLRQLGRWEALVGADPTDEEAHLRLVEEHIRRGDRGAALRQLDWCEAALRRELDVGLGTDALGLREVALAMPVEAGEVRRAPAMTGVPRPPTPTIGRGADVELAVAALERSRIVTLLGPGGVGKTRLATEVALRVLEDGAEDVCFVDLTKVRDARLVIELIARELGLRLASETDAPAVVEDALRGLSMLLVLDNFEHVLDAARDVAELVSRVDGVRALVTSRARLHLAAERVVDVEPLLVVGGTTGPGDAVVLFEQVAAAIDPAFRIDEHLDDVDAICRAVDGLPLGIELAAGHVRTLPPPLLRTRLAGRLEAPGGAARDAPSRQQTIPAMIDWSLQLLAPSDQRLFARLGIFSSAVSLGMIEAVCAEPGSDVVECLARLVDHSLVRRVGTGAEPRYVLLELLRERARALVPDDDLDSLDERHASEVLRFLDDLDERRWGDASATWLDQVAGELPEIRAAHERAVARGADATAVRITADLGTFWHREGHHVEGRGWVAQALEHEGEVDSAIGGRLRLAAGLVEWPRDALASRVHWTVAAAVFRALGDDRYLSYTLGLLAGTYIGSPDGDVDELALCDEAIALARQVGEPTLVAQALNVRGEITRVAGDDDAARVAYEEGMALAVTAGDLPHQTIFLSNLSYLASHRGDHAEARRLALESLRLSRSLGRRMMTAWSVSQSADAELGLGEAERAAVLVGAGDAAFAALGVALHPGDRPEHERVLDGLRRALDPARLDELLSVGGRLSLDAAADFALSDAPVADAAGHRPA